MTRKDVLTGLEAFGGAGDLGPGDERRPPANHLGAREGVGDLRDAAPGASTTSRGVAFVPRVTAPTIRITNRAAAMPAMRKILGLRPPGRPRVGRRVRRRGARLTRSA